jgi:tyrosyl-tRNA synthetase
LADLRAGMSNVPHVKLEAGSLVDVLVNGRVCASKREAREFINNGAISINGEVVKDPAFEVSPACAIGGEAVVIRRGKKKFFLGEF